MTDAKLRANRPIQHSSWFLKVVLKFSRAGHEVKMAFRIGWKSSWPQRPKPQSTYLNKRGTWSKMPGRRHFTTTSTGLGRLARDGGGGARGAGTAAAGVRGGGAGGAARGGPKSGWPLGADFRGLSPNRDALSRWDRMNFGRSLATGASGGRCSSNSLRTHWIKKFPVLS